MAHEIDSFGLAELQTIGSLPTPAEIHAAASDYLRSLNKLNHLHWSSWEKATAQLDDDAVVKIFRAIVVLERANTWTGGSVGAAIWLYRILEKRGYHARRQLADWALMHRGNPYVPFGTRTSATSYIEYEAEQRHKAETRRSAEKRHEAEREAASLRGTQRQADAEQRRAIGGVRAAVVHAVIADLRDTHASHRVAAVLSSGLPLDAIPAELLCPTALRAVSSDTLHELLDRIGRRRGAWTSIKREILDLLNGDRKRCHQ
jgi:hypothetical protein